MPPKGTAGQDEDDEDTAARGAGGRGGKAARGAAGGGRPRRRWVRVLRWTAGGLAAVVLAAGVAGYLYYRHLNANLTKEDRHLGERTLEKPPPNEDGQSPLNILLLGSDERNSEANQDLGGARQDAGRPGLADTQILLHVAADRSHITAVSIPRDTVVTIPQCTDPEDGTVYPETENETINVSMQHGGPGCTVATWEELTGIYIDHFMMLDFAGVVDMADAVGGVPVCVSDNVFDPDSRLRLEAGESVVKGEQALQWLRTRYGFEDGSDIGRTKAQQMYLTSMATQLQEGTKLTDPGRLMNLAEAATNALTVDEGLGTVDRLYDLGEDIRRVPSEEISMITMPWQPDPAQPAHVLPDPTEADRVFSAIRNDVALDDAEGQREAAEREAAEAEREGADDPDAGAEAADPPGEIPVAVLNGTGASQLGPVSGRAGVITAALQAEGFAQAFTDATPVAQEVTTLSYPGPEQRANAAAVAAALGLPESALVEAPEAAQLTLVIGADWREGTVHPLAPETEPGGDGHPGPPAEPEGPEGSQGSERSEESSESEDDDGGDERGAEDGDEAGGGSVLDEHEGVTGTDEEACMTVNPGYTW